MFDTGNVLFCKSFQFNNGAEPLDKYFIVLKRHENKIIIGSLPTSKDKIPAFVDKNKHGCVNKDDRCFNCYFFKANNPICENGFSFPRHTFAYGDEIDTYQSDIVDANYVLNENYIVEGKLTKNEYNSLLECILNSSSVKFKIKKLLI